MKNKKSFILTIFIFLFAALFLFSAVKVASVFSASKQSEAEFEALREAVSGSAAVEDGSREADFSALYEQNSDFRAWLTVPDTVIDYPVMQREDDAEYYLRRDFNGSPSVSGTLFIGKGCQTDSDVFIIYGHNMKTKTMFGTLSRYADNTYRESHCDLELKTQEGKKNYRVFAVLKTSVTATDEYGKAYSDYVGTLSAEERSSLLALLKANALYYKEPEAINDKQILMLSTCSYHTEDGRFAVAAYCVDE